MGRAMSKSSHEFPVGSSLEITLAKESADAIRPMCEQPSTASNPPLRSDIDNPSDLVRLARQAKSSRNDRNLMFHASLFG